MAELKPCPFCGGTDLEGHSGPLWCGGPYGSWVFCRSCRAHGPEVEHPASRDKAWNRGTPTSEGAYEHPEHGLTCHVGGCKLELVDEDEGTCYYRPVRDGGEREALERLDDVLGLHEGVEIIYVVDGYEASLTKHDGATTVATAQGDTILAALYALAALTGSDV